MVPQPIRHAPEQGPALARPGPAACYKPQKKKSGQDKGRGIDNKRGAFADKGDHKKFMELVNARNSADQMAGGIEKSVKDLGDAVTTDEKAAIDKAVSELREAVKGSDKADIEAKTQALMTIASPVMQRATEKGGAAPEAGP